MMTYNKIKSSKTLYNKQNVGPLSKKEISK